MGAGLRATRPRAGSSAYRSPEYIEAFQKVFDIHAEQLSLIAQMMNVVAVSGSMSSASDKHDAIESLVRPFHPFDAIEVLGVPVAAFAFANGAPRTTVEIAPTTENIDGSRRLELMRDTDCTGGVAGVLVGALHGNTAFPSDWVEDFDAEAFSDRSEV